MHNLILLFQSILIGIASIMPGVSGSVLALTFGIYDRVLSIIKTAKYKENFIYLLIIFIGVILGIIIFSNIMLKILKYKVFIFYILMGIILEELPSIFKNIKKINKKIIVLSFLFTYLLSLLSDLNINSLNNRISNFKLFLGGIFFSIGKVFPGISSSFFLMLIGVYKDTLKLMSNPLIIIFKMDYYLPFILGMIISLFVSLKILKILVNKYYNELYNVIVGVVLESLIFLFPGFKFEFNYIIGVFLMIFSFTFFKLINK